MNATTDSAGATLISSTAPAVTPVAPETPGESNRKWRHRLTQIDVERRTAVCSTCGPTPIRPRKESRPGWRCLLGDRARDKARKSRPARGSTNRRYALRAKFGLSIEDYDALLLAQDGVCAICLNPCATRRHLAVDHDHETGRIRGLLCNQCNRAIGLLGDDVSRLGRAISYLTK